MRAQIAALTPALLPKTRFAAAPAVPCDYRKQSQLRIRVDIGRRPGAPVDRVLYHAPYEAKGRNRYQAVPPRLRVPFHFRMRRKLVSDAHETADPLFAL